MECHRQVSVILVAVVLFVPRLFVNLPIVVILLAIRVLVLIVGGTVIAVTRGRSSRRRVRPRRGSKGFLRDVASGTKLVCNLFFDKDTYEQQLAPFRK